MVWRRVRNPFPVLGGRLPELCQFAQTEVAWDFLPLHQMRGDEAGHRDFGSGEAFSVWVIR
jgi:hypothetical protein